MASRKIINCPFCGASMETLASMPAKIMDSVDITAIKCLADNCPLEGNAYTIIVLPESFGKDTKVQDVVAKR